MKMWKKLAAALLAAALAMAMLAACGTPPVQDPGEVTTDAHKVVQWVKECAAEYGVTLEEDDTLYQAMELEVSYDQLLETIKDTGSADQIKQVMDEKEAKVSPLWNGRKNYAFGIGSDSRTHYFTERDVKTGMRLALPGMLKNMGFAPTKIGGAIMTYKDGTVAAMITVTDR